MFRDTRARESWGSNSHYSLISVDQRVRLLKSEATIDQKSSWIRCLTGSMRGVPQNSLMSFSQGQVYFPNCASHFIFEHWYESSAHVVLDLARWFRFVRSTALGLLLVTIHGA